MTMLSKLSPSITTMIRTDHSHVLMAFHKYHADLSPTVKEGLVHHVCLALEVHAQLEEEIFYPAMQAVGADSTVTEKSVPEHAEMRRLIGILRDLEPTDATYDSTFNALMRDVMHHVADEETSLLPAAEQLLADRLQTLGAQMTKRRMQLMAPHAGELAVDTMKAMPASKMLMVAGAVLAGTYVAKRSWDHRHH